MRYVIGIAVTLGFSLLCEVSNARQPNFLGNSPWQGHPTYANDRVSARSNVSPTVPTGGGDTADFHRSADYWNQGSNGRSNHISRSGHHSHRYPGYPLVLVGGVVAVDGSSRLDSYADRLSQREQYQLAVYQAFLNYQTVQAEAAQAQLQADDARNEARRADAAMRRTKAAEDLRAFRRRMKESNHPTTPTIAWLSPEQFDRQTGRIAWPEGLQDDAFGHSRRALEQYFANRAANDPSTEDSSHEISKLIQKVTDQLKEKVTEMPCTEYVSARRFLHGLANELRTNGRTSELAANRALSSDRS